MIDKIAALRKIAYYEDKSQSEKNTRYAAPMSQHIAGFRMPAKHPFSPFLTMMSEIGRKHFLDNMHRKMRSFNDRGVDVPEGTKPYTANILQTR